MFNTNDPESMTRSRNMSLMVSALCLAIAMIDAGKPVIHIPMDLTLAAICLVLALATGAFELRKDYLNRTVMMS